MLLGTWRGQGSVWTFQRSFNILLKVLKVIGVIYRAGLGVSRRWFVWSLRRVEESVVVPLGDLWVYLYGWTAIRITSGLHSKPDPLSHAFLWLNLFLSLWNSRDKLKCVFVKFQEVTVKPRSRRRLISCIQSWAASGSNEERWTLTGAPAHLKTNDTK